MICILYILKVYNELTLSEVSYIAGLAPDCIFTIYKKMLTIFERTEDLESEQARRLLKSLFTEMVVEINMLPADESNPLT
jgi:hypothetical protein